MFDQQYCKKKIKKFSSYYLSYAVESNYEAIYVWLLQKILIIFASTLIVFKQVYMNAKNKTTKCL